MRIVTTRAAIFLSEQIAAAFANLTQCKLHNDVCGGTIAGVATGCNRTPKGTRLEPLEVHDISGTGSSGGVSWTRRGGLFT